MTMDYAAAAPSSLFSSVSAEGVPSSAAASWLARAHTFLAGGRTWRLGRLLQPGEDVFELVHPRIGEHQGRVVMWHKRGGGQGRVPVRAEIFEKRCADIGK